MPAAKSNLMKLYYWPKTRAFRVLWALEEIGAPYDLVRVNIREGAQATPQYRALNPMMKVPALAEGKRVITESGAILLYLADNFPTAKLAPAASDPRRGRFLQLLFFAAGCLEPAMAEKFAGATPHPYSFGWGDLERVTSVLADSLTTGPWLLDEFFTVADILIGEALAVATHAKLIEPQSPFSEYLARLHARPAFQNAKAIEDREAALGT
jgi:glutathione S-transferase